jgi:hypothetical protein
MDYKAVIEIFDTLESDDKTKEVYAHFGLAVFLAQSIEQQAINMIAICRQANDKLNTQVLVDTLWDNYHFGSRTLGKLIYEILQLYQLTEEDAVELKEVLKLRNYIAHDYFRFNAELFYSDSGQKRMIRDFIEFRDKAKKLDSRLIFYTNTYMAKIGLTDEMVSKIYNQTREEWQQKLIEHDHKTIIK